MALIAPFCDTLTEEAELQGGGRKMCKHRRFLLPTRPRAWLACNLIVLLFCIFFFLLVLLLFFFLPSHAAGACKTLQSDVVCVDQYTAGSSSSYRGLVLKMFVSFLSQRWRPPRCTEGTSCRWRCGNQDTAQLVCAAGGGALCSEAFFFFFLLQKSKRKICTIYFLQKGGGGKCNKIFV
ncbi:hypothetical protein FKM82_021701 [Ascaphus truei]